MTICLTNLQDMTSLVPSGRQPNETKYCTEERKTSPVRQSQRIRPLFNRESPKFARHSRQHSLKPYRIWRQHLLPVGSYRSSNRKTTENAASDSFDCIKSNAVSKASSNFSRVNNIGNVFQLSGVSFRLTPPCGGLLVEINWGKQLLTLICLKASKDLFLWLWTAFACLFQVDLPVRMQERIASAFYLHSTLWIPASWRFFRTFWLKCSLAWSTKSDTIKKRYAIFTFSLNVMARVVDRYFYYVEI